MAKKNKQDTFNNPFSSLKGLPVSAQQKVPEQKPKKAEVPTLTPEPVDDDEQFALAMGQLGVDKSDHIEVLERPEPTQPETSGLELGRASGCVTRPEMDRRQLRKAMQRMGQPEATLDLHGVAAVDATQKVAWFLENAVFHGFRVVRIVTGKGTHSDSGPVIRPQVEEYLSGPGRQFVLEWICAPPNLGGEGALLAGLHLPINDD